MKGYKQSVTIFPRDTYLTTSDGGANYYRSPESLRKLFGQAKEIRFQLIGYHMDAVKVQLQMFETPAEDIPPAEVVPEGAPFSASTEYTSLRPTPATITGPFSSNVEFLLSVAEESAQSNQLSWDGKVVATLIFEG